MSDEPNVKQAESPTRETTSSKDSTNIAEVFQRVSKQETHIRNERAKISEAQKAMEADRKEAEEYRSFKKLRDSDPLKALETLGLDYSMLTQKVQENSQPIDPVVKGLKEKQESLRLELESFKSQQYQEKVKRAEKYVEEQISLQLAKPEYDIIEKVGAQNAVREYIEAYYNETGEAPEFSAACDAVADYIADSYTKVKDSQRLTSKLLNRPNEPKQSNIPKQADKPKNNAPKTVSNKMVQSTGTEPKRILTDDERVAAATAALKNFNRQSRGEM